MNAEQSLSRVHSKSRPPRLAAAATIVVAALVMIMLVAMSCSVARLP